MNIKVLNRYMKYCETKGFYPEFDELKYFNYMIKKVGFLCK